MTNKQGCSWRPKPVPETSPVYIGLGLGLRFYYLGWARIFIWA